MTYKTQHAKVVRIEVSIGKDDDDRTIEQFIAAIRYMLTEPAEVAAHNVTLHGGYYLIDGHVCLPEDYDPATKDRKPGTYPPEWAGGPARAKPEPVAAVLDDDETREFVRVQPTRSNDRHPDGRRVRKDKGVKRGPRKAASDAAERKAS